MNSPRIILEVCETGGVRGVGSVVDASPNQSFGLSLAVAPQVSVARPSSKDIKNSKLYVTNLPDHFNQDQVVEVFEQVRGRPVLFVFSSVVLPDPSVISCRVWSSAPREANPEVFVPSSRSSTATVNVMSAAACVAASCNFS